MSGGDFPTTGAGIGQPPVWVLDPAFEFRGKMTGRVLSALASPWGDKRDTTWRGSTIVSGRGTTTGDLAAKMGIKPETPDRQSLEDALAYLRKHGLVKFEFDRVIDKSILWWITSAGLEVATRLIDRSG